MKTSHTPAPWSVGKNYHTEGNNRIDITYPHNEFGDTALIAIVRTTDSTRGKADARLIAAAPDLLQIALEIEQVVISDGSTTIVNGSAFHQAMQLALAKARE